jgi:hypothetical protein
MSLKDLKEHHYTKRPRPLYKKNKNEGMSLCDRSGPERCPSWPKGHDWKSCVPGDWYRGFESLSLRQNFSLKNFGGAIENRKSKSDVEDS